MSIGEIGGVVFLGFCAICLLIVLVELIPGDTTRHS